jgi:hypothetical protein
MAKGESVWQWRNGGIIIESIISWRNNGEKWRNQHLSVMASGINGKYQWQ